MRIEHDGKQHTHHKSELWERCITHYSNNGRLFKCVIKQKTNLIAHRHKHTIFWQFLNDCPGEISISLDIFFSEFIQENKEKLFCPFDHDGFCLKKLNPFELASLQIMTQRDLGGA